MHSSNVKKKPLRMAIKQDRCPHVVQSSWYPASTHTLHHSHHQLPTDLPYGYSHPRNVSTPFPRWEESRELKITLSGGTVSSASWSTLTVQSRQVSGRHIWDASQYWWRWSKWRCFWGRRFTFASRFVQTGASPRIIITAAKLTARFSLLCDQCLTFLWQDHSSCNTRILCLYWRDPH